MYLVNHFAKLCFTGYVLLFTVVHRYPMHVMLDNPLCRMFFKSHTGLHHKFYTYGYMQPNNGHRDWYFTLFPLRFYGKSASLVIDSSSIPYLMLFSANEAICGEETQRLLWEEDAVTAPYSCITTHFSYIQLMFSLTFLTLAWPRSLLTMSRCNKCVGTQLCGVVRVSAVSDLCVVAYSGAARGAENPMVSRH